MTGHKLIIHSLKDTDASCSCGHWHYSACSIESDKDAMLKDQVKRAHRLHLAMVKSK
jgi:hypothetical protein